MRDVALSLMPVAILLSQSHPVYLVDLRGHGKGDKPGSYAMAQFIFDLHQVLTELIAGPAILFGHSLGGQITTRFAALYPDLVRAAIIVEGLGPPRQDPTNGPGAGLQAEGQRLQETLSVSDRQRPLPSIDFAAKRLLLNNPRLTSDRALELAHLGTEKNEHGELVWAFDPRVSAVFAGLGPEDSARHWPHVSCPTCVISGSLAAEYWGAAVRHSPPRTGPLRGGSPRAGHFAPGELADRVASFTDAEHIELGGSGHMVHFDEPDRLAGTTLDFLRRRL
jgi:pimeloyl-ACP methyl ester carboxylesterase